jgi:hypothetical protein
MRSMEELFLQKKDELKIKIQISVEKHAWYLNAPLVTFIL